MRHSPALTVRTRFGGMQQNAAYRPLGTQRRCWLRGTPAGQNGLPASGPAGENVTPAR